MVLMAAAPSTAVATSSVRRHPFRSALVGLVLTCSAWGCGTDAGPCSGGSACGSAGTGGTGGTTGTGGAGGATTGGAGGMGPSFDASPDGMTDDRAADRDAVD